MIAEVVTIVVPLTATERRWLQRRATRAGHTLDVEAGRILKRHVEQRARYERKDRALCDPRPPAGAGKRRCAATNTATDMPRPYEVRCVLPRGHIGSHRCLEGFHWPLGVCR